MKATAAAATPTNRCRPGSVYNAAPTLAIKTRPKLPFECTYTTTRITRTTSWFCCCCRWLLVALSNNASQAQPNFISIQARFLVQQKQRALGRWRVSVNDDAAGDRMVTPLHFEMRVSTPLNSKQQNSVLKYRPCVCVYVLRAHFVLRCIGSNLRCIVQ